MAWDGGASRALRLHFVLDALAGDPITPAEICAHCPEVLSVTGAAIALAIAGEELTAACLCGPGSDVLSEAAFTLGEGPTVEAARRGVVVLVPDVGRAVQRWPRYVHVARRFGIDAVFAFPLAIGETRIGALSLFRNRPGALAPADVSDAVLVAQVATHALLAWQADVAPMALSDELAELAGRHTHVHQATGMVAAQLGVPVQDALVRLRAEAWASRRRLAEVAADVVGRRMRFEP